MKTKTINGMIMSINDSIAEHLLCSELGFYDMYRELRSNMNHSLLADGIETIYLTDGSEVYAHIRKNIITM